MNSEATSKYIDDHFETTFLENLMKFVEIPNLTPSFDTEYLTNGLVNKAIDFVLDFAKQMAIPGLEHYLHKEQGMPPMLVFTIPGDIDKNVMIYGHLDK